LWLFIGIDWGSNLQTRPMLSFKVHFQQILKTTLENVPSIYGFYHFGSTDFQTPSKERECHSAAF